jgi:hypothetical protein
MKLAMTCIQHDRLPRKGRAEPARVVNARGLEHFQAKWIPVRVKKMRQNKNLELRL